MGGPTHFPHGVTNEESGSLLGALPIPNPASVHMLHDDFALYAEPPYLSVEGNAGVFAWIDALGGALEFETFAVTNDTVQVSPVQKSFEFVYGKQIWFQSRHTVVAGSAVNGIHWGLQSANGSPVAEVMQFNSPINEDFYHVASRSSGGVSSAEIPIADFVVGEEITFGFHWDGIDLVTWYVNDVPLVFLKMDDGNSPELPTLPAGVLFPSFGVAGNSGASNTQLNSWTVAEEL